MTESRNLDLVVFDKTMFQSHFVSIFVVNLLLHDEVCQYPTETLQRFV